MSRLLCVLFLIVGPVLADLPADAPVPGGVAVVPLKEAEGIRVSFNDRPVLVAENAGDRYAIVGVPLSAEPGEHWLEIGDGNSLRWTSFEVAHKEYEEQRITIKDHSKVEPSEEDLERIWREQAVLNRLRETWSEGTPELSFSLPIEGTVTGVFGLRRFFNDQPRSPHSGLDIAAPAGTPIRAPADGTVLHAGDFFFSGKLVYLDHGRGLLSAYGHLQDIEVEAGQKIRQGDPIGTVGSTGRATGAHLHWSVYLNQTPVNPELLLSTESQAKL